ncbi:unnamed protein product [Cunninghamella blakesleeana]
MAELTLGNLFTKGQSQLTLIEESSLNSIDPEYQKLVHECITNLTKALDLVERLAMFSSNEIIDDINASNLKFLLTSTYLGQALLKNTKLDCSKILKRAKEYFHQFLSTCQEHQLMKKGDLEYYEKQTNGINTPAAQQRQEKIARYKREKALKETIQQLREQLEEKQKEQEKSGISKDDDEETEREWVLALIDLEIIRTLEQLHGIDQELVMVLEMEKMRQQQQHASSSSSSSSDQRIQNNNNRDDSFKLDNPQHSLLNSNGPLLSKEGRPLRPFVITSKKQQIKDQVFRPGWNLPTMTVDEYLQQEMDRGNIIKGGGEEPKKKEIDDNDYEALDADTMKKREWDEFVEANPKGWGNRGNKG